MILLGLSRERDKTSIVTEALGSDPVGPSLKTFLYLMSYDGKLKPRQAHCFTFLFVHYDGSDVGPYLVQACKEGVARSLHPGVTLGGQLLCGASIAISDPVFHKHIRQLRVRVMFHPINYLSTREMMPHSERGSKNLVCASTVI
ncbi:uncharacterized protein TNCV_2357631 [Trichonephila clavipes]|nr:uncharacterized protein TNCV_2357631 [Trichonephila clavipes]